MKTARNILETLSERVSKYAFFLPMGIEYEAFLFKDNGEGVDVLENIDFFEKTKEIFGIKECVPEVGKNMLEIVLEKASSLEQYQGAIEEIFNFFANQQLSKNWRFLFNDNPRYCGIADVLLYQALHHANGYEKATVQLSTYSAFQVNFGVQKFESLFSDQSKKLLYVLNNLSTVLAVYFEDFFKIKTNRLPNVFVDWNSGKDRMPQPLSWNYINNVENNLKKISYVVVDSPPKSDNWVPACGKLPEVIDDIHCKMIWWFVRLSGPDKKSTERVEIRSLPNISPVLSLDALVILDKLVRYIVDTDLIEIPYVNDETWLQIRQKNGDFLKKTMEIVKKIPIF